MAASNEGRLLSRAIRDRDIKPLIERGLDQSWFHDEEHRRIWTFLREHWQTYGEVPTATTVKDNWPTYRMVRVEDSVEYLLDQLVAYRRRGLTVMLLQEAGEVIEEENDHEAALERLAAGLAKLGDEGLRKSSDMDLSDPEQIEADLQEYRDLSRLKGGMRGIPTGFKTIDRATSGLQDGQLITIVATPKAGKSTLALRMAINIMLAKNDTMFLSYEMSNSEQRDRYYAMLAGISHTRLTRGQLTKDERLTLGLSAEKRKETDRLVLVEAANTVSGIAVKIEKHKPRVVFVDGVYLMLDEISGEQNTPQALTNITRNLKRLAQRAEVPIVISTQALEWKTSKRSGVQASSIGYSSSFFQDSDVILGLDYGTEDDPMQRTLKVVESRNCGKVDVEMMWDWETARFEELVDLEEAAA